ncbi:NAD(P)/FAD-dependent oxidoreductase [Desulfofundulus thermosubterraneus]|uniref:Dehydrogenase (Flavoprotein) n=1 Tax=Desulfofundulus thermosubterraneus DSM 16057 TaxID=1121432 RepID=A0A1M6EKA6_9FIRM|nr:FAD-dependent oxidoreductase [Desulfofundulus thermosubterraneus]SHI85975.1 Dehydrogenase (flavoprotein) [Desulfofundulus thermosubterraneus DSM 16057]
MGRPTPRIAIIGAGISGLACALELERHGIAPAIFEQRSRAGETFNHVGGLLQLMSRPIRDEMDYLRKELHLPVKALAPLKRIIMHMPNVTRTVTGKLGYLLLRGQDENSTESQLYSFLKTPVYFNRYANWQVLARHYDYVVVADGTPTVARTLGCWQEFLKTWVRGAVVLGNFDPNTLIMWVNTKYTRHTYAYLTPFNAHRASLILIVSNSNADEVEEKWRLFWEMEELDYQVLENFSVQHTSGYCYPPQVGNVLMIGNAGGFMEPFLGFGVMASIRSGVYAGRALARGESYTSLTSDLRRKISYLATLRQLLNNMENEDFDNLVKLITTPGIKQFIYNTNIDILQYVTALLRFSEQVKKKIRPGT